MANNHKKKINGRIWSVAKGVAVYVLIALASLFFFYSFSEKPEPQNLVPISQIIYDIKDQKIEKITLEKDRVTAKLKNEDKNISARKEEGESIYKILESSGVDPKTVTIEIKDTSMQDAWMGILGALLPVILMVVLFFFIFRQAREGAHGIFSFAQSRARLFTKDS